MLLIGQRMGQFVDQGHAPIQIRGNGIQNKEPFFVGVVVGGHLLAEKVDGLFYQAEVGRHEAEHFESQLFGTDLLRIGLVDMALEDRPKFVVADHLRGNRSMHTPPSDLGERAEHLVNLIEKTSGRSGALPSGYRNGDQEQQHASEGH